MHSQIVTSINTLLWDLFADSNRLRRQKTEAAACLQRTTGGMWPGVSLHPMCHLQLQKRSEAVFSVCSHVSSYSGVEVWQAFANNETAVARFITRNITENRRPRQAGSRAGSTERLMSWEGAISRASSPLCVWARTAWAFFCVLVFCSDWWRLPVFFPLVCVSDSCVFRLQKDMRGVCRSSDCSVARVNNISQQIC